MSTKQIVVIRKDLKMRRGKEIAQAGHGFTAWLAEMIQHGGAPALTAAEYEWLSTSFRKITLQVETEDELVAIHEKAKAAGVRSHLITDSGLTEFNGVPTKTCVCLGPDYDDVLNPLTGHLKLY